MNAKTIKLGIGLAAMLLVGLPVQSFSQDYCYFDNWSYNAGTRWWNSSIPDKYTLSEDQIAKMNSIRSESIRKLEPLEKDLSLMRMKLLVLDPYGDGDMKKIEKIRSEMGDIRSKISDINFRTQVKIKKIMNPRQSQYFTDGGYGWWDMEDHCWHTGHGKKVYADRQWYNHGCRRW